MQARCKLCNQLGSNRDFEEHETETPRCDQDEGFIGIEENSEVVCMENDLIFSFREAGPEGLEGVKVERSQRVQ